MDSALRLICFCIIFSLFLIPLVLAQDENQFVYNGFSEVNLSLSGNSYIHSSGLLQLTTTFSRKDGRAFYPIPIKFNTSSSQSLSFSTNFVFAMVPGSRNFSGNGMTFFLSPSMEFSEAVTGSFLGLFNITTNGRTENHILAVELDTVRNPELGDIDGNHVGIDVNSLLSIESATAAYFSEKERTNESLVLGSGNPTQIWIVYDAAEKLLNVTLAPITISKPDRPLLSKRIDFSQMLLDSMYIGFSASTGTAVATDHYILGWSFSRTLEAQNVDILKLPSLPAISPPSGKASQKPGQMIIILLVPAACIMLITIGGVIYIVKKKKYEEVYEEWEKEYAPQRFSYKNLYNATKGFKEKELVGKGGFGKVYRGVLPSSNDNIAVKRVSQESRQGMKEFVAELASMGRLRHRNLVQLRGYCRRKEEFLLVYDYMPNGSLDKILYSNTEPNLNWFQRFQIIRGIASGLLYLHEEWEQVVLHRDVKPGNVLLDADLNGRLGDFGLARLHDHGSFAQTTKLVGTLGYMAPELMRTGKATTSTDVYAFGIFMLEVACGRRPLDQQGLREAGNLVYWVTENWKRGSIFDSSDPKLEGDYAEDQMELALKLGLFCSHSKPTARPSMRQVMQCLDGDTVLPDILSASTAFSLFTANDEPPAANEMPFPSLLGNGSLATMSTNDSILAAGR